MKRLLNLILAGTLSLSLTACSFAIEQPSNNVYKFNDCNLIVIDKKDFFSAEEESRLVTELTPFCEQSDCDVVILATNRSGDRAEKYLPDTTKKLDSNSIQ